MTDSAPGAVPAWPEEPPVVRRILEAAVEAFAERGFHGTTTRHIALRAGLSPAGLYVHFPSKTAVLGRISTVGHEAALDLVERALADAEQPAERVHLCVRRFVAWHARHRTVARVVQYELHSLDPADRAATADLRRRLERRVEEEVRAGVRSGDFTVDDPRAVTRALLSLCIDVARWFDPAGRESPEQVADLYADLALRMLGTTAGGAP